jgi:hypothetical protein
VVHCSWNDNEAAERIVDVLKNASIEYTIVGSHGYGFFVAKVDKERALSALRAHLAGAPGIQIIER